MPVQQEMKEVQIKVAPVISTNFMQPTMMHSVPASSIQLFSYDPQLTPNYTLPAPSMGTPSFLAFDQSVQPRSPYVSYPSTMGESATGKRTSETFDKNIRIVRKPENMVGLPNVGAINTKAPPVCSPEFVYNAKTGLCVYSPSFYEDASKNIVKKSLSKNGFGQ
jgi:hypothetical protein